METIEEVAKKKYKALKPFKASSKRRALKPYKALDSKTSHVQNIALGMADKLNRPDSYQFFLKCAWHLSEETIWDIVDRARRNTKLKSQSRWAIAALSSELKK